MAKPRGVWNDLVAKKRKLGKNVKKHMKQEKIIKNTFPTNSDELRRTPTNSDELR